ncbi:MAG TPA: OB-fold domain-containing protein [Acidimicrobiales bacterium]|nr:OB-fold domain-containing protein [Acidimicrobiales bacterium]
MSSPQRRLPLLDDLNRGFWTAGSDNELRLRRCPRCRYWLYPPRPACPRCWQRDLPWEATSGRATLYTYTLNHRAWNPDVPVPYLIGIVELAEQPGLRLTTNIVNCEAQDVVIGMPLRVVFEQQGEHFVPLFEPDRIGHAP